MSKKEDVRLYYDRVAPELFACEAKNIHLKSRMGLVLELIDKYAANKVRCLDMGCGSGYLLYHLAKKGLDCTGVDLSAKSLAIAERRLAELPCCRFKIVEGDVHSVGVPDGTFDLVTSTDVLEHVEHPDVVLGEAYRLLKPDGICVVSVPNWWSPYGLARFVYERALGRRSRVPIDNWLNPKLLEELAVRANFRVLELRGTYFLPLTKSFPYQETWYDSKYRRFESVLSRTFLAKIGLYLVAAFLKCRFEERKL